MAAALRTQRGLQRLLIHSQAVAIPRWTEKAANAVSVRTGLSVQINNPRDTTKELNKLWRKCKSEKLHLHWRKQEFYTSPSEQRVVDAKATEKRIRKQNFKAAMEWVTKRRARGF